MKQEQYVEYWKSEDSISQSIVVAATQIQYLNPEIWI